MRAVNEELNLLIKSKYPVVCFETIDEIYTIRQLKAIAEQLDLSFYQWSLTDGLRRGDNEGSYYQTKEPVKMLQMVQDLLRPKEDEELKPGLFVLKDFEKYLEDVLALRLFKDIVNRIKGTKNTFVIVAAEYKLPRDIEADSAHLIGGYPVEDEIKTVIKETAEELKRTNKKVSLSLSDEELNKITNALKGLSIQQIRNVINQCLLADNILDINDLSAIETYKKKVFDQEGLLEFYLTEDKNNIAGFDNLKRWLTERKSSFSPDKTTSLPVPKGLLLMGVQGCGKSLAVKVIARELNLALYRLDLARLYSKYIGETEQNLRKALMVVEKLCPVCLWIDEIEKGFAASGGDIDGGVSQRILGTFLTWMQERKTSCFIAATANDIYRLPPEFLRKGRFDEIFFVDLPNPESREQLLRIHLKKRELKPEDFDLKKIVDAAEDFSGAEIEQAIIAALYRASTEKERISTSHIIEQIKSTKPLSVLKAEGISELRAWAKERTIPA
ncbi:MAG: AAA family ATPase [Candidatus Omnitrophica bacterium]|nr:AAA family ATPase [Candidatus Omnitrophota bacterium]